MILASLLFRSCMLLAQPPHPSGSVELPANSGTKRITLSIDPAPRESDYFIVRISTNQIQPVLILPNGERITEANADPAGLSWYDDNSLTPPLGSKDGGHILLIHFQEIGQAGTYVVELAAAGAASRAEAEFISQKMLDDVGPTSLRGFNGYKEAGPVSVSVRRDSAVLDLVVDQDEEGALVDISVSDPAAVVSLALPDGTVTKPGDAKAAGLEWETVKDRKDYGASDFFSLGGFLLPRDGTHHVLGLEKAAKGAYQVRVERGGAASAEVAAAFVPVGRMFTDATNALADIGKPKPGEVLLAANPLPDEAFVGDKLDLTLGLRGDPVAEPVNFDLSLEYKQMLPYSGTGPVRYTDPVVRPAPITLTRGADGGWHGTIVPDRAGLWRVGIKASGKRTSGESFTEERVLNEVNVKRVAARFVSLTERAVDEDNNGTLDRLEISANLDVVMAGEYEMRLMVRDAKGSIGLLPRGRATLAPGRQTLTVSIPAKDIRRSLKEGPWIVSQPQIFRPEGNTFGDFVAAAGVELQTKPYRMDQWERGPVWGEEKVTLRGIRPAASGKFQFLELDWQVFAQPMECSWHSGLSAGQRFLYVGGQGTLLPGLQTVSVLFPAAGIAAAGAKDWIASPTISCQQGNTYFESPNLGQLKVQIDPAEYEPGGGPTSLEMNTLHVISTGDSATFTLQVKGQADATYQARVVRPIPGITADARFQWSPSFGLVWLHVSAAADASPGRYFLGVELTNGVETASAEQAIDIVPARPRTR